MRVPSFIGVVLLFGLITAGCVTSTPYKEAPISPEKKKQLRKLLIGTWEHTHTMSEPGAEKKPMSGMTAEWTFREDGTGSFRQKVDSIGMDKSSNFTWKLKGRNLILTNKGTKEGTPYRIDNWTKDKMKWFNYTMSNYYIISRRK